MTVNRILNILESRGLQLLIIKGQPRIGGPKELITPELASILKLHREELLPHCKAPAKKQKPPTMPDPEPEVARPPEDYCRVVHDGSGYVCIYDEDVTGAYLWKLMRGDHVKEGNLVHGDRTRAFPIERTATGRSNALARGATVQSETADGVDEV